MVKRFIMLSANERIKLAKESLKVQYFVLNWHSHPAGASVQLWQLKAAHSDCTQQDLRRFQNIFPFADSIVKY